MITEIREFSRKKAEKQRSLDAASRYIDPRGFSERQLVKWICCFRDLKRKGWNGNRYGVIMEDSLSEAKSISNEWFPGNPLDFDLLTELACSIAKEKALSKKL